MAEEETEATASEEKTRTHASEKGKLRPQHLKKMQKAVVRKHRPILKW
ncbi:MAG: hypothetical protein Ct9H90mP8_3200 [Pseudomonadota bacterium]|nr:MAG: hypothetical protein Ct9H90mP8_3200 [Pseudomonadota bacterium]